MEPSKIEIEEGMEMSALGGGQPLLKLPSKVTSIFPALSHRNYQYYFIGQGISLVGFWLQVVGMGWLVFQITGSPFWVGAVAAAGGLPFLFFSVFAGVFVDRIDKQKLLVWTQIIEASVAASIGLMALTHTANLPTIFVLAFISGTSGSIDLPARQAFVIEMVGKKDLASAISVNIGVFNGARFVGPALAGLLIGGVGVGWTFILNALSFIPGILAIRAVRSIYPIEKDSDQHPLESLREGLNFAFHSKKLLYLMILGAVTSFFVWPYQTLMPAIAETVFHSGASGLGALLSAAGLGSLAGAAFTSAHTRRDDRTKFIFLGLAIGTVSLLIFAFNHNFLIALLLLFAVGFGIITQISTINTYIQTAAPDQMRGRINAVYLTAFVGMMPLGNAFAGFLAEKAGLLFTIAFGSLFVLGTGTYFYLKKLLK